MVCFAGASPYRGEDDLRDLHACSNIVPAELHSADGDQSQTLICLLRFAGALSSQLATLESSLHAAILDLQSHMEQITSGDHSQVLTMLAVRLQQPEVNCVNQWADQP